MAWQLFGVLTVELDNIEGNVNVRFHKNDTPKKKII